MSFFPSSQQPQNCSSCLGSSPLHKLYGKSGFKRHEESWGRESRWNLEISSWKLGFYTARAVGFGVAPEGIFRNIPGAVSMDFCVEQLHSERSLKMGIIHVGSFYNQALFGWNFGDFGNSISLPV